MTISINYQEWDFLYLVKLQDSNKLLCNPTDVEAIKPEDCWDVFPSG